ncbi:MAG: KEOPS complex kinase/ATPase Bud32 [Candidatus Woesearchaeota archaeon]|nr:KEOPS complex kinase/ATPase Bud32 [Candidatus Woesearchaeota archaeon]
MKSGNLNFTMEREVIARGAEAEIVKEGGIIIKERVPKSYRLKEIDESLRKARTKREVKVMKKLSTLGIPTARIISEDYKNNRFSMEFLNGKKLRDIINKVNYEEYSRQIGALVAKLHENNIIHADLTTSNMIVVEGKIHLIDFGLTFFSERVEDKAVDIHLLRQALESKHQEIWERAFSAAVDEYRKNYKDAPPVLERLSVVEMRGRYKKKGKKNKENKAPEFENGECD